MTSSRPSSCRPLISFKPTTRPKTKLLSCTTRSRPNYEMPNLFPIWRGHSGTKTTSQSLRLATSRQDRRSTPSICCPRPDLPVTRDHSTIGVPMNMRRAWPMSWSRNKWPSWWLLPVAVSWSPRLPMKTSLDPNRPPRDNAADEP